MYKFLILTSHIHNVSTNVRLASILMFSSIRIEINVTQRFEHSQASLVYKSILTIELARYFNLKIVRLYTICNEYPKHTSIWCTEHLSCSQLMRNACSLLSYIGKGSRIAMDDVNKVSWWGADDQIICRIVEGWTSWIEPWEKEKYIFSCTQSNLICHASKFRL